MVEFHKICVLLMASSVFSINSACILFPEPLGTARNMRDLQGGVRCIKWVDSSKLDC